MKRNLFYILTVFLAQLFFLTIYSQEDIRLIVRADDMGFSNTANKACIMGYQEGIITSVEVIVPGAWFLDAAAMLEENPGLDAGVHLALTSEWENLKFGPISTAKGLTDADGYFPESVDKMLALKATPEAIEQEFRAQIELARKYIPQLSHLSTHMFWHDTDSTILQIIQKLSTEYKLPISFEYSSIGFFWETAPELKEKELASYLDTIGVGTHIFILHPMLNNEEGAAIKGSGLDPNVRVGLHRQKVLDAVTSDRIKSIIDNRKIKLIGLNDLDN